MNVLKALAGTDWGQDTETITNTYKATCRSILEYGSPIWSPDIKPTLWNTLQNVQNSALRVATGCHQMAAIEHLHRETKVLPLKEHGRMMTQQYIAASHLPGHPGRNQLGRPPSVRNLKQTMMTYENEISSLIPEEFHTPEYKRVLKTIHSTTVETVLASYPPNKVLGQEPPEIHKEEADLPRNIRSTLSQLRSGYSKILNSYNHRLNEEVEDKCPKCLGTPHDTLHLFNCPANPTVITPEYLWTQPSLAAHILGLEQDNDELDQDN